jgi:hypothetical protein
MGSPAVHRVELRAAARGDALGLLGVGLLAVTVGPLLAIGGAVAIIPAIIGVLMALVGLGSLALGAFRFVFPMSHPEIRALGATPEQRAAAVSAIEAELASSLLERVHLAKGAVLSLTASYLVIHRRGLLLARREDLLWAYGKVVTHKRYGITTGRTNELCVVSRHGEHSVRTEGAHEAASALALVSRASPRALVGYRDDLKALPRAALAAQVDRVPFASGSPAFPHPAGGPPLPAGFVPGGAQWPSPHSPSPHSPSPHSPSPQWPSPQWPSPHSPATQSRATQSSVVPWVAIVGGVCLAGVGLLFTAFFSWVASHPSQPDDVRFGSCFAIASVIVCIGPGALAVGLAGWRLFARRPPS